MTDIAPRSRSTQRATFPRRALYRGGAALLAAGLLFSLDRLIFAYAERAFDGLMACRVYPDLDAACIAQPGAAGPYATSLAVLAAVLVIGLALGRGRPGSATPFLGLLLAAAGVGLAIDLAIARAALAADVMTPVLTALSVLLVVAPVFGAALAPSPRGLALAAGFYLFGLALRLASFQLAAAFWPLLYDAGRMVALYGLVVLANSFAAVLALAGPAALAAPRNAEGS